MVEVHKQTGTVPLVQIHDELAFSVDDQAEAENLCRIMEKGARLQVPTPCDISLGENWGALETVDFADESRMIPEEKGGKDESEQMEECGH